MEINITSSEIHERVKTNLNQNKFSTIIGAGLALGSGAACASIGSLRLLPFNMMIAGLGMLLYSILKEPQNETGLLRKNSSRGFAHLKPGIAQMKDRNPANAIRSDGKNIQSNSFVGGGRAVEQGRKPLTVSIRRIRPQPINENNWKPWKNLLAIVAIAIPVFYYSRIAGCIPQDVVPLHSANPSRPMATHISNESEIISAS